MSFMEKVKKWFEKHEWKNLSDSIDHGGCMFCTNNMSSSDVRESIKEFVKWCSQFDRLPERKVRSTIKGKALEIFGEELING